jgi:hypothetical protein
MTRPAARCGKSRRAVSGGASGRLPSIQHRRLGNDSCTDPLSEVDSGVAEMWSAFHPDCQCQVQMDRLSGTQASDRDASEGQVGVDHQKGVQRSRPDGFMQE